MPPPSKKLQHVSDTAHWVAAYRAEESERRRPVFRDPFARRLAGERGFELLDSMPRGRMFAWPMVARTVLFDRFVTERLAEGVDLVVNLAAGLDARPYRMELPSELNWVEVDLPAMVDSKAAILEDEEPVCRLERIGLDLADGEARRGLFRELGGRGRRVLVLTEGLLIYLDREDVAALAGELAAVPTFRWWATDLASPGLLRSMSRTWGRAVEDAGAPFRFAPEEGPEFFEAFGWRRAEVHSTLHAAGRMGRLPWYLRLLALLPEPKRVPPRAIWSGQCLFEREGSG